MPCRWVHRLVAVVRFNDFDVVAVVQHARHRVQDMEGQVHAHAVIGGEHNRVFCAAAAMAALPLSS